MTCYEKELKMRLGWAMIPLTSVTRKFDTEEVDSVD